MFEVLTHVHRLPLFAANEYLVRFTILSTNIMTFMISKKCCILFHLFARQIVLVGWSTPSSLYTERILYGLVALHSLHISHCLNNVIDVVMIELREAREARSTRAN